MWPWREEAVAPRSSLSPFGVGKRAANFAWLSQDASACLAASPRRCSGPAGGCARKGCCRQGTLVGEPAVPGFLAGRLLGAGEREAEIWTRSFSQ